MKTIIENKDFIKGVLSSSQYKSANKIFNKFIYCLYREYFHKNERFINSKFHTIKELYYSDLCNNSLKKHNSYKILQFIDNNKLYDLLTEDENVFNGLINILRHSNLCKRNPSDFIVKTKNRYKLLYSFIDFLFCDYKVPYFMYSSWTPDNSREEEKKENDLHIQWFFYIGSGKSVRELPMFPYKKTKRLAHEFVTGPNDLTVMQAACYAHAKSIGANDILARNLLKTFLVSDHTNLEFWEQAIFFFSKAHMFDYNEHIVQIFDYIRYHKFNSVPKLIPNFSFKGRTLDSIMNQSEEWHKHVHNIKKNSIVTSWDKNPKVQDYSVTKLKKINQNKFEIKYTIEELTNSNQLYDEGKKMKHCVYSYIGSCKHGKTSIFSLRENGERMVTIELNNRTSEIVQIKGLANRKASEEEMKIVSSWVSINSLKMQLV